MAHKDAMIEAIKLAGSEFPELVFNYYVAEKIIKFSAHRGFAVTHGAFMDADVIAKADNLARIAYCERIIKESPNTSKALNAQWVLENSQ